jgi:PEP-CTERM motif
LTALWKHRLTRVAVLVSCFSAAASELRAGPLTFQDTSFLISSSGERLDLFSNPGVIIEPSTYEGTIFPPAFIFSTRLLYAGGPSITDTIRFTYRELGFAPAEVSQDPFSTGIDPVTLLFVASFEPISHTGVLVPATLTVDLLNSAPDFVIPAGPDQGQLVDSFTYTFSTLTPVPEPSTLLLLGTGVACVALRRRRRLT